jgi:ATP-dependent DNA helicase RecG
MSPPKSPPQVKGLVEIMKEELTRMELQHHLNLSDKRNFNKNYLDPALTLGLIERTIADKPNSRLQKYRLTEKGRQLKEKLTGENN